MSYKQLKRKLRINVTIRIGGAEWLRIEFHEDIFVVDHILQKIDTEVLCLGLFKGSRPLWPKQTT